MMTKRTVLAALVAVNLVLFTGLLLSVYSLPPAHAQRRGAAGDYVAVTCRADKDYDALYIVDLATRNLHCFVPNRQRTGQVAYGGMRNLERDFKAK